MNHGPRLRLVLRVALTLMIALALFGVPIATSKASVRTQEISTRAKHACGLLTTADITSLFTDAPLDPGPKKVRGSKKATNFTRCAWDDKRTNGQPVPQLGAYTFLARDLTNAQRELLSTPQPNTTARSLTPAELDGLGTKGVMEIQPDGAYGTLGVLKGDNYSIVSVGYLGAPPIAPILDAEMLALARKAAPRV